MPVHYKEVRSVLTKTNHSETVVRLFPQHENDEIDLPSTQINNLGLVLLMLQSRFVSIFYGKVLFDGVPARYSKPEQSLGWNCTPIENYTFRKIIETVQREHECQLQDQKQRVRKHLWNAKEASAGTVDKDFSYHLWWRLLSILYSRMREETYEFCLNTFVLVL